MQTLLNKLKEKLVNALGHFGFALFMALIAFWVFLPFSFLGLPVWADTLILLGIIFIPILGTIGALAVWVFSFINAISAPIGVHSILYFIALAAYVIIILIPFILNLFTPSRRG